MESANATWAKAFLAEHFPRLKTSTDSVRYPLVTASWEMWVMGSHDELLELRSFLNILIPNSYVDDSNTQALRIRVLRDGVSLGDYLIFYCLVSGGVLLDMNLMQQYLHKKQPENDHEND